MINTENPKLFKEQLQINTDYRIALTNLSGLPIFSVELHSSRSRF